MNDALTAIADLTPIAAVVIIAGVAASALTQWAKRPGWTKQHAQRIALGIAVGVGVLAYVVSGVATVFPASVVEVVSTGVVTVAGVAIMSRAAYAIIGHAMPDGKPVLEAVPDAEGVYEVRNDGGHPETVLTEAQAAQLRRITDGDEHP